MGTTIGSLTPPHSFYFSDLLQGAANDQDHLVGVSTAVKVLLFDVRNPLRPVATWDHGMQQDPADLLIWLPSPDSSAEQDVTTGRLLAVNTTQGQGFYCEFTEERAPVALVAQQGGSIQQVAANPQHNFATLDPSRPSVQFAWQPACTTTYSPANPPRLLFEPLKQCSKPLTGRGAEEAVDIDPGPQALPNIVGLALVSQDWKTGQRLQEPYICRLEMGWQLAGT
jgi:hypothetical protein